MRGAAVALAMLLVVAGCAAPGSVADRPVRFAVIGDAPYTYAEEAMFEAMIQRMNTESLDFVIHVGDFKSGNDSPCTDELYVQRLAMFAKSAHPLVLVPGDNDWTDCRRKSNGAMNPINRLQLLRRVFYPDQFSLGVRRIALERQPGYPENQRWRAGNVEFATVHVVGSADNSSFDAENKAEHAARKAANLVWLREAFARASSRRTQALVITIHANPEFDRKQSVYSDYLNAITQGARGLAKPVLLIHGDTHLFRVDRPLLDFGSGATISNVTRLESYGSPLVNWIDVRHDPSEPSGFAIHPGRSSPPQ